jgi:protein-S-isoprenylcysteine O-methyltransferase
MEVLVAFLLDNGAMYHIANGVALFEYLITIYFKPALKSYPYVTIIGAYVWVNWFIRRSCYLWFLGIAMVLVGQALRSTAMIHASTNFSHSVAFRKRQTHELVTDGVYAYVEN